MKKILSSLLITIMLFSLCACIGEAPIEVKGAFIQFYDTSSSVIVVFDYNDTQKVQMSENPVDFTLEINDKTYEAIENSSISMNAKTGVTTYRFDSYIRYTGYKYAVGYDSLPQDKSSETLFVCFNNVDITALSDIENAKFKIGESEFSINTKDFYEKEYTTDILKGEDDYETAYQVATFKMRMDCAYGRLDFLDSVEADYGEDYSYVSKQMGYDFDTTVTWGASGAGNYTNPDGTLNEDLVKFDLAPLNIDKVKTAHPEIADQIDILVENYIAYSKDITDGSKKHMDIDVISHKGKVRDSYKQICDYFEISILQ